MKNDRFLGDFKVAVDFFDLTDHFSQFQNSTFTHCGEWQRAARIYAALCALIQQAQTPCFLLPAVLDYLEKVREFNLLEGVTFAHFEMWLNQFSGLSAQENYAVRAKIAGKSIPREAYQTLFPIGMGKVHPGSHIVTGHGSPDLDTTIASFWGWLDAFAARVSEGIHLWNVPGGAPPCEVELDFLFHQLFGSQVFPFLAKTRTTLSLTSLELMTQKGMLKASPHDSFHQIESTRGHHSVVLVDETGQYLGDWRHYDVEDVRSIIILLNGCMHWFFSHLQTKLISLFAKKVVTFEELDAFFSAVLLSQITESPQVARLTEKQRGHLHDFLIHVLKIKGGLHATFKDFAESMQGHFDAFLASVDALQRSTLFDQHGKLIENRPEIFHHLEKIIHHLEKAIQSVEKYVDRLQIALEIKLQVLKSRSEHLNYRDDVEEMRSKMGDHPSLTVAFADETGKTFPVGIVHAHDLFKPILGTVSLRDFCNRDETKIPSYLEIISIVDHHKTVLNTASAPVATIADAQSSNVLCAELSFSINDAYSLGGMTPDHIQRQFSESVKTLEKTVLQRLLQRWKVADQRNGFFIDSRREYIEYVHFLFGILDDTDLLTKVSYRDVICVTALLNRMKSLMLGREVEILSLEDLEQDKTFAAKAAKRILQHPDMYSLYQKIYSQREKILGDNVLDCARGMPSMLFADTKVQNGCARVGQTKLFSSNYPVFKDVKEQICARWYEGLKAFCKERTEVDLHLHMISTIASAKDVYEGRDGAYDHSDEMWLWIPFTEQSIEHLKQFLNAFKASPAIENNTLSVEFHGDKAKEYEKIFIESFLPISGKILKDKSVSIAVIKYKAGSLNSRKAQISPYMPKLVS